MIDKIVQGDNLEIMKRLPSESIDLIYIDPPFFTQKNYKTFTDKYKDIYSYLDWLMIRIKEMYRLLKETGSIYVHLDWHSVHYVKVEMDKIFGYDNFLNEVIWCYGAGGFDKNRPFNTKHDSILLYSKTEYYINNKLLDIKGTRLKTWIRVQSIADKSGYLQVDDEYRLYPTQKPEKLLEVFIKASSNEGDLVADFFCGSGTTLAVAKKLGRNYFGCDISEEAIKITKDRLSKEMMLYGNRDITPTFYCSNC